MLIAVSGVDCAGKTTQIELLRRALLDRGRDVVQIWHRPGYSDWLNRLKAAARRIRPSALPTSSMREQREQAFRRSGVRIAWSAMALFDVLTQYAIRVRMLLSSGKTVICDRYIEDALMDLELRFPELARAVELAGRAVRPACPKPDLAILLTLSWDEVLRRASIKREPFPDPPEIRRLRYEAYMRLARSGDFAVLDAEEPIDSVHRRILARCE